MRGWILGLAMLVVCCLTAQPVWANAFTMAEKSILARAGVFYFLTSQWRDDNGDLHTSQNQLHYQDIGADVAMRWAPFDSWELGVHSRYRHQFETFKDPETGKFTDETSDAVGDVDLDTMWRFVGGERGAAAVSALVKLPYLYDKDQTLPAGDGQLDAEARLLGALRFSLFTGGVDFGYRYRDGDPADQWVYGVDLGFTYSMVYGRFRLDGRASAKNEAEDAEQVEFMYGPDYAIGTTAITFGLQATNHLGVDFTAAFTAYGRNIAQGTTLLLAANLAF